MKNVVHLAVASAIAAIALSACQRAPVESTDSSAPARAAAKNAPVAAKADGASETPAIAATPRNSAPRDAITDSVITARIKAGILSDPGMNGADISVNTDRGVVSLTGLVKSQEQIAIASAYAQRQDGVMRVDNQLSPNLQ